MAHEEKQNQQSGASPNKAKKGKSENTGTRSIEKTEYDEIIKSLQFYKMLDNELKNSLFKSVDEVAQEIRDKLLN